MSKKKPKAVKYIYVPKSEYSTFSSAELKRKRAIAGSTRDVFYTINWLLNNSNDWDSLYRKLNRKTYSEEREIIDIYRQKCKNYEDLNVIAIIQEG